MKTKLGELKNRGLGFTEYENTFYEIRNVLKDMNLDFHAKLDHLDRLTSKLTHEIDFLKK
ncbi:MAG: hypothetical protein PF542_03515 [Nanoarchaeota archaeon]|jgi:hypothetical protein|nr:hypothetical protein [Nanoarchaeota archaeon]